MRLAPCARRKPSHKPASATMSEAQPRRRHHHQNPLAKALHFIQLARRLVAGNIMLIFVVVGLGLNIWIFAEVAGEVYEGETQAFDNFVLKMFRDANDPANAAGPQWLANAARDITALGSIAVLMLVTFVVLGYLAFRRQWAWAGLVALASFGGAILTWALKGLFQRARPDVVPHLDVVTSYSFPSGHAMISAVVYITLGAMLARVATERRVKLYFLSIALVLAGLVGLSRVYVGVHYPTDVVAGWSAGMIWAAMCWLLATWLERRSRMHGQRLSEEKQQAG